VVHFRPHRPHLEASIIHDYLYLAWTDFRLDEVREQDWDFADHWFRDAMKSNPKISDRQRRRIYGAVRIFGWDVFRDKDREFASQMTEWMEDLPGGAGV
jgi:hypothetical protein